MLKRSLKSKVQASKVKRSRSAKTFIGWREWVALPLLGISAIKAKVDTGARTSTLHAYEVTAVRRQGRDFVRFKVHPQQRNTRRVVECEAPLLEWRQVTDSSGRRTLRPVIRTIIDVGGQAVQAEVTLIARDAMGFRMLIGREALKSRWYVDPSKSFIADRSESLSKRKSRSRSFQEEE